jgi:hypothetical protein
MILSTLAPINCGSIHRADIGTASTHAYREIRENHRISVYLVYVVSLVSLVGGRNSEPATRDEGLWCT